MVKRYDDFNTNENKNPNPHRCDSCGSHASIFPAWHAPLATYILEALNNPARQYCDLCFYKLMDKEHEKYTAQHKTKKQTLTKEIIKDINNYVDVDFDYNGRDDANE